MVFFHSSLTNSKNGIKNTNRQTHTLVHIIIVCISLGLVLNLWLKVQHDDGGQCETTKQHGYHATYKTIWFVQSGFHHVCNNNGRLLFCLDFIFHCIHNHIKAVRQPPKPLIRCLARTMTTRIST